MTGLLDLGQEPEFTCVVRNALQEEANLTYGGKKQKTKKPHTNATGGRD